MIGRHRIWGALVAMNLVGMAVAQETLPAQPAAFPSDEAKTSYALGANIGENLRRQGLPVDAEHLLAGLADALAGGELRLSKEEIMAQLQQLERSMRAGQSERGKKLAQTNAAQGEAFLAENATKKGVKTLASGLQYKVVSQGTGAKPKSTDTVKTHYEGRLLDGTVFDSSYARGEPATFPVDGVIAGWTEALQLMPVGSKWQLYIPAGLAYGERGAGADIGPNATLIFDIELLGIE